jgi:SAM-dependent methyltransferase
VAHVSERATASAHYAGEAGESYSRYQLEAADVKARVAARKFAPYVSATDSVVDFGCGLGGVLARLDAAERIGVEANPRSRALASAAGVRTVERTDDLAPHTADVVICHHSLEHTLSPLDELVGLREVLRPTGLLALVVPVDDWREQRRPDPRDVNHHLFTWTPQLLANLLGEAGYRVDECRVVRRALPGRLTGPLGRRLPARAFSAVMALTAIVRRRPELLALARPR